MLCYKNMEETKKYLQAHFHKRIIKKELGLLKGLTFNSRTFTVGGIVN